MKRFIYMLAAFALMGAVSCQPDEEVAVHASFTTDKGSYDVGRSGGAHQHFDGRKRPDRHLQMGAGQARRPYETTRENISYDQAGRVCHPADRHLRPRGRRSRRSRKTIRVVDNNIRPWPTSRVARGRSWRANRCSSPTVRPTRTARVVARVEIRNHDLRGKQNPGIHLRGAGATEVSLTVTDNKKGRNTKTVTIDVGRGAISLDLLWS